MATLLGTDKDVEKLVRQARKAGWTVTIDGGTHIRWDAPHGGGFRSALTGSRGTRLQVERNLARHDPAHFGTVPASEPARRRVEIGAEVEATAEQLLACVDMLRALAEEGCAGEAAELLRMTRDILREGENRIRAVQRRALVC